MSTNPTATLPLTGTQICLRAVVPDDAAGGYLRWMNDPVITRYLETKAGTHTEASLRDYIRSTTASADNAFLAIVLRTDNRHVGNIKLGPINRHHLLGDIGIIIGEQDCWGRGLATEAIALLKEHAFAQLGLHKLTASCYANNAASAKAFEKAGFTTEAVRPAHFWSEGNWVDGIFLGCVNPANVVRKT
jgi:RimJ/RimL family protein N-acetyltransferase